MLYLLITTFLIINKNKTMAEEPIKIETKEFIESAQYVELHR